VVARGRRAAPPGPGGADRAPAPVLAAVLVVAVLVQSTVLARLRWPGSGPTCWSWPWSRSPVATDPTTGRSSASWPGWSPTSCSTSRWGCRPWSGRPPGSPWARSGCT
jgi:hypothetical protein